MKAISLYQPWASWIAAGMKTVETRGHDRFRSLVGQRIAIHAAQRYDGGAIEEACRFAPHLREYLVGDASPPPQAVIVCTAFVRALRRLTAADSPAALCDCGGDRWGLVLTDIRPVTGGKRIVGHQGIFDVDVTEEPQATPLLDAAEKQRTTRQGER